MISFNIEEDKIMSLIETMESEYGCHDEISIIYSRMAVFCISGYYENMIGLFLEAYKKNILTDININIKLLRIYSEYQLKNREYERLIDVFSQLDDLFSSAELLNTFGIVLYINKQYNDALVILNKAYSINPLKEIKNNIKKISLKLNSNISR